ncbi:4'-phosphopantetheinyl transferase family protein [Promicromonospora iranensis]|uniref:4'-phosphopantetheinyl transferase n=1 Tax=Promicromonospora iranensis TaxID=1105144 RepID=A0ABU2CTE8_9MICO|nr:4'-phosphopantetheinyl transferase superfamily protein [Promicromonospora iranensis]MDR7384620.1 4'-phosphopantetheinyl transferase [Promicromonospora iranensis]
MDLHAAPAPRTCDVWLVPVRRREAWTRLLTVPDREHLVGLDQVATEVHLTSRAAQRLILSRYLGVAPDEITVDRTCERCGDPQHGRPQVPGAALDYSVSHTRAWVLVAVVGDGRVGADLDARPADGDLDDLAAAALTPAERRSWRRLPARERADALLAYWTRKEATTKLTGHGLTIPLRDLDVTGPRPTLLTRDPAVRLPYPRPYLTHVPAPANHSAALATTTHVDQVRHLVLPDAVPDVVVPLPTARGALELSGQMPSW